jgi:glutamate formiminotransferase / formiminotetrahydrofolate cyclodeaminase
MPSAQRLIECVPNFSEGRDMTVIKQVTDAIETVEGVRLLDVDPGRATNRTVVTFVGAPEAVVEAAVRAIRKASEVIDMRKHTGEHPRMGATDVCPLVPIAGVTMDDTVAYARELGRRVGDELGIPVYLYEHAATTTERRNLATIRAGEYEGLAEKIARPEWRPDFGPAVFNATAGATVVGARDFLVAYNINLNTTSTRWANAIAFDVREKGRPLRVGDPVTGALARDERGEQIWQPGRLRHVKGIGWFIPEYGIAQVSLNLTNLEATPVHVAFDESVRAADARGIRVTGSELVGLIPLKAMLDAGRYFLRKQRRSVGVSESELVKIAIKSLGLEDLAPFDPHQKIIEYRLDSPGSQPLLDAPLRGFADELASESPAPGGGSTAAYVGALGVALATMVANLSAHKRGWDDRWETYSDWAERGQNHMRVLLDLVDADTRAFNDLMAAFRLPAGNADERALRDATVQAATRRAIEVPLEVVRTALASMAVLQAMAETGNPSSVSDAGVGALCARAAVLGAFLNVQINTAGVTDRAWVDGVLAEGERLVGRAQALEAEILAQVQSVMRREAGGGDPA